MTIMPLNPSVPVIITTRNNASAECIGWIDYSPEHDLMWICAMDEDGTVWIVPNKEIRLHTNWTLGRRARKILPDSLNLNTALTHRMGSQATEKTS